MEKVEYSAIKQIFTNAITLKCYLEHMFGKDHPLELPNDKPAYKSLLADTMVVVDISTKSPLSSNQKVASSGCSISDAINRLIAHLLRQSRRDKEQSQNCLTFGYKAKGSDANVVMASDMNTECRSVQTGITIITSASWQTLLNRIGECQLRDLLENAVFLKTVNGSYLQVSGPLASELARKQLKLRQEKKRARPDDELVAEDISLKRCSSNASATSEMSSTMKVSNGGRNSPTIPMPPLTGKTTLMRFKLLYNHRSCPLPGLPNNHPFLKKPSADLFAEIFPDSIRQRFLTGLDFGPLFSSEFIKLLDICKEKYKAYDSVKSMRKFCTGRGNVSQNEQSRPFVNCHQDMKLKALKGVDRFSGSHIRFNSDSESDDNMETIQKGFSQQKKRKRMRGSRGGASVKQRRLQEKNDKPCLFSSIPIENAISLQTMAPTTVGNRLIDIIFNNVAKDISAGDDGFQTQEDTIQDVSQSSIIQNTGESLESAKTKSQRTRIRRKMKKLLTKLCKSPEKVKAKSDSSVYDPPSILLPLGSTSQMDCGRIHHINRHFPLSPLASHASSPIPRRTRVEESNFAQDLEDALTDETSGKVRAPVKATEIWEFSTPTCQVSEFIKSIVRATFPCDIIWGSKHNEDQMMRHIDTYIGLGRTESMSLSQATHGVQLKAIPWLSSTNIKPVLPETLKLNLLLHFIYWMFNHFITPCIATTFYVTEVEGKLSELFFFKKKMWLNLIRNHLPQFHKQFVPIHLNEKYFDPPNSNSAVGNSIGGGTIGGCINVPSSGSGNDPLQLTRAATYPLPSASAGVAAFSRQTSRVGTTQPSQQQKQQLDGGNRQSLLFNKLLDADSQSQKRPTLEDWSLRVLLANKETQQPNAVNQAITNNNTTTNSIGLRGMLFPSISSTKTAVSASMKRLQQYMDNLPTVRFVPKKATLRPITNLKAKSNSFMKASASVRRMPMSNTALGNGDAGTGATSFNRSYSTGSNASTANNGTGSQIYGEVVTNKMLYNSLYTLQQIYALHEDSLSGFGVFGFDEIYRKLRLFKELIAVQRKQDDAIKRSEFPQRSKANNEGKNLPRPKYYIAALDLEKCYDNINTSALYDLVRAILVGRDGQRTSTGTTTAGAMGGMGISNSRVQSKNQSSATTSNLPPLPSYSSQNSRNFPSSHTANASNLQQQDAPYTFPSTSSSLFHNSLPSLGYISTRDCVIHKYYVTHLMTSMERIYSKILRYVAFDEEVMTFKHAGTEIAKNYGNSIISDNVSYSRTNAQEILKLLKAHLFQHVVKLPIGATSSTATHGSSSSSSSSSSSRFGRNQQNRNLSLQSDLGTAAATATNDDVDVGNGRCCTQIKGIPQGSVLSSLLCNVYYGFIENMLFAGKTVDIDESMNLGHEDEGEDNEDHDPLGLLKHTMIIRLVDDYLIVSTKQSCVEYFLNIVMTTYPHYGGFVNAMKTKTNFQTTITQRNGEKMVIEPTSILSFNGSSYLPWCGYLLNIETLEVCPDATRILNRPLTHSISIDSQQMGNNLKRMIKAFFRMKCHAILIDSSMNDRSTIIKNLYELYLLAALRTITHIKKLKYICHVSIRSQHLIASVYEGIIFASKLLRIRTNRKISRRLELHAAYGADKEDGDMSQRQRGDNFNFMDLVEKTSEHDVNRIALMKEAEKKIKYFGSCPLKANQAIYLGMKAFHHALTAFPITFDDHHHLLTWIRISLSRCQRSMNNGFQNLINADDCMQVEAKVLNSATEF